jgi:hypothetical protein
MSNCYDFFKLGLSNIAYFNLFEHILFIIALCGIYSFGSWQKVTVFVLLFIIGYQITFIPSTFHYFTFPPLLLRFLMPLTVLVTAISNFYLKKQAFTNKYPSENYRYFLSFFAGTVHGFAFPETLQSYLLNPGDKILELLCFNMGIITGIGIVVFFLLFTCFFLTYFIRLNLREWNLLLSGACAGIALYILASSFMFH